MSMASPRTGFNTARLVRILADLELADMTEPKQSFAARLGQWLDLGDAISLSAALKPGAAQGAGEAKAPVAAGAARIRDELARVRAGLAASIGAGPQDGAGDFAPYHRYYLARQRDMDAAIGPLRADARAALAALCPRLGQLAAVDAVFDGALRGRERSLLMSVPLLLEKRFEHLRGMATAPANPAAAGHPDNGWLAVFRKDMQSLLLAELDFRLQPVAGLVAALAKELDKEQ